jgi:hypothetical protein
VLIFYIENVNSFFPQSKSYKYEDIINFGVLAKAPEKINYFV